MGEVKIQKATMKNLKDIQKLNLLLFENDKKYDETLNLNWIFGEEGTEYFRDKISKENSCAFIAIIDNEIVGYLVGWITKAGDYRNISQIAELENMFVLEQYRNLGIGTKLCEEFINWCKLKGIKRIKVVASAQNTKAINFYKQNKFSDYDLTLERNLK